jgi:hypothetical protein
MPGDRTLPEGCASILLHTGKSSPRSQASEDNPSVPAAESNIFSIFRLYLSFSPGLANSRTPLSCRTYLSTLGGGVNLRGPRDSIYVQPSGLFAALRLAAETRLKQSCRNVHADSSGREAGARFLCPPVMYAGSGLLLDCQGTRKGLTVVVEWWSLACGLHLTVRGFAGMTVFRFFLGLAEPGARTGAVKTVSVYSPAPSDARRSSERPPSNCLLRARCCLSCQCRHALILAGLTITPARIFVPRRPG